MAEVTMWQCDKCGEDISTDESDVWHITFEDESHDFCEPCYDHIKSVADV